MVCSVCPKLCALSAKSSFTASASTCGAASTSTQTLHDTGTNARCTVNVEISSRVEMKSENGSIGTGNIDVSNIKMHLDIGIVITITASLKPAHVCPFNVSVASHAVAKHDCAQMLEDTHTHAFNTCRRREPREVYYNKNTTDHTRTHASTCMDPCTANDVAKPPTRAPTRASKRSPTNPRQPLTHTPDSHMTYTLTRGGRPTNATDTARKRTAPKHP